jgi:hypothetical protein
MAQVYKLRRKNLYKKHDRETINRALEDIRQNKLSYRTASRKYGIAKSVLFRHAKGNVRNHGGQTVLTPEEENYFILHINHSSEWRYPIDCYDLRVLVKNYLDKLGRTEVRFKNNFPGKDFVYSF